MATLKPNQYVRVPVITETEDEYYPRLFVLGRIESLDEVAGTAKIKFYDLFNSKFIYGGAISKDTHLLKNLIRAKSPVGFPAIVRAEGPLQKGKIVMSLNGANKEDPYVYFIELEKGKIIKVSEDKLSLDFTGVDLNPLQSMMRYEFQNPTWFASRYIVSATMHVLNNAVYGFRSLAGCRTFMMPHQVMTVLRCLQSEKIRYMLADEVGMGKTIEACSIVKVQKEKYPEYKTAYLVPDHLAAQWRFELQNKFAIDAEIASNDVDASCKDLIIPHGELNKWQKAVDRLGFDMIIVDETHKILKNPELYKSILKCSKSHGNILLLSATPVNNRRKEFKLLLTLLDPSRYENMTGKTFDTLVSKQHDLGDKLFELYNWIQDCEENKESILEDLKEIYKMLGDSTISSMLSNIEKLSNEELQERFQHILAYICEEYRMEKNIIRNRRDALQLASRTLKLIPYEPSDAMHSYPEANTLEALQDWINSNSSKMTDSSIQDILCAAFSSPWALKDVLRPYHPSIEVNMYLEQWCSAAEAEISGVRALLEDPDRIHGRLIKALDYLEQETELRDRKSDFKAVVFTNYTATMDHFVRLARFRLGNNTVAVLSSKMDREQLEEQATMFQNNADCRLMVCDPVGTEGRNLQAADLLIHLDTPWDISQVEQRIGRLDRIGRNAERDVLSVVFYAENTLENQLVDLWNKSMNVYSHSLSGLEIVLDPMMDLVMQAMRKDIRFGLRHAMDEVLKMKEELDNDLYFEQIYDMASVLYHPLQLTIQNMLEIYQNKENTIFADAMMSWSDQAGFSPSVPYDFVGRNVVEFNRKDFSPKSSTNCFLIPPDWDFYRVHKDAITGTFDRQDAIKYENLLFFAPGDQVFDHITFNALTCFRGRCCAFEVDMARFNYNGLIMIWNVEPNMGYLFANHIDPIMMAKFRAFLPLEQIVTLFPVGDDYSDVTTEMIQSIFVNRRMIQNSEHLGRRSYKRGLPQIERFMEQNPPEVWKKWVLNAYKQCEEKAREIVKSRWEIDTAREEARRIVTAENTVNKYYGQQSRDGDDLRLKYAAVLKALENFNVKLDAIVYLRVKKYGSK